MLPNPFPDPPYIGAADGADVPTSVVVTYATAVNEEEAP